MARGLRGWGPVAVLPVVLVAACDRPPWSRAQPIAATTIEGKLRGRRPGGEEVRVWRDPETGCQYLLWERRERGGITPRLSADGRPICRS